MRFSIKNVSPYNIKSPNPIFLFQKINIHTLFIMSTGQYIRNNTVLGDDAMANALNPIQSIGSDNTAYGFNALMNLADNVNENSAFGSQALVSATNGENSAFGAHAGAEVGEGTENALFGNWAGRFVSGNGNTAYGYRALAGDEGSNNIPVQSFATGGSNTAIGNRAMRYHPDGNDNVAVGYSALVAIDAGGDNIAIGSGAGGLITTGDNNTFIGKGADASDSGAQQRTAIGAGALADTDNTIILGKGENVGIGTTVPDSQLHVQIGPLPELPRPAIHGKGDPGILAEGSVSTAYAIQAKGSLAAPAIYVEGGTGLGGTLTTAPAIHAIGPDAYPAIYAEATGEGAAAIYAQGSATDPAIHAHGTQSSIGLFAEGSPGIYAQNIGGNSQHPAIYAKGSDQGYAIKAETSGTVAAIYAEGTGVPAIEAVGSGSGLTPPSVIHAEGNGSGPVIYAEGASGSAIQTEGNGSDPVIRANASGSGPAIQATGSAGRAIEAQSSSVAAIYATGSPGIDAVGSATNPAIHAVGSATAPGIRVEASVSGSILDAKITAAIYAEGSAAHAIYAKTTGSAAAIYVEEAKTNAIYARTAGSGPAIQAVGASYTSLSSPGSALFTDGGFRVKVRIQDIISTNPGTYQIYPDDHIIILCGTFSDNAPDVILNLPCPPAYQVQDGQMFIIKCWAKINIWRTKTRGGYTIAENRQSSTVLLSRNFNVNATTHAGGVTYVFYGGIYYEMVDMLRNT
jgi:hypothetical protein